ncbi:hypothetical protein HZA96_01505 [Candidatus Woesearchaeota archaeon]|nr:hypothetical protein [Candidatus Woesearchaeota archaeon]
MHINDSAFIQSFKQRKDFIFYVFLDIIYYVLLLGIIAFVGRVVYPKLVYLRGVKEMLNGMQKSSFYELQATFTYIRETYYGFFIYAAIVIICLFLLYTFLKSYFWYKVRGESYTLKTLLKFSFLNIVMLCLFVLVGYIIIKVINQQNQVTTLLLILYPAALYSINLLHLLLAIHKSLRKTAKAFFSLGIVKFYKFIIPYLFMIAILIILLYFMILLQFFLPDYVYYIIYLILFVVFTTWCKLYLLKIIERNQ